MWTGPRTSTRRLAGGRMPTSPQGLHLVVTDIDAARAELAGGGAEVSEVFHDAGGVFHNAGTQDGSLDWLQTVRATARWPRSATRTATAGSSRRSPRACRGGDRARTW